MLQGGRRWFWGFRGSKGPGEGVRCRESPGSPANYLLRADGPIPTPSRSLRLSWRAKPHVGAPWGQVPRGVPFLVPQLRFASHHDRNNLGRGQEPGAPGHERWQRRVWGKRGRGLTARVVQLSRAAMQGCVPMVIDSMEVTWRSGGPRHGSAAGEGGPVQADVLLLWRRRG